MRLKLFLLISLAGIALVASPLYAEVFDGNRLFRQNEIESYPIFNSTGAPESNRLIARFDMFTDYADLIFNSNHEIITLNGFPVSPPEKSNVRLRLVSSAFDNRTQWFRTNDVGEEILVDAPTVNVYKGSIENEENSEVILVYCEGYLNCSVKRSSGERYDITSTEKGVITIAPFDFQFTVGGRSREFEPNQAMSVKIDEAEGHLQADTSVNFTELLEAKIIIDANYRFFMMMNSDYKKASAYIASVMSYVSLIYERDLNVRLVVPTVLIRTSALLDPYGGEQGDKIDNDLNKLPDQWKKKRGGDIATVCLFANYNYDAGGLSRFASPGEALLCDRDWSYSVVGLDLNSKYPNYGYTWDVNVTAHELGHIFGAPHTHVCYYNPPLDTCATKPSIGDACLTGESIRNRGTIMSYCHLVNGSVDLIFHPRQIPHMRKSALSASCLRGSSIPYINITGPTSKWAYEPGQEVIIRWTYSKVASVNIYYSTDEGAVWIRIAENVSAANRTHIWKAPGAPTDKIILKIEAAENNAILDVSDAYLAVMIPSLVITRPLEGDEFGEKETALFRWEAPLTELVNVYFSSDGGATWKLLKSSISAIGLFYKLKGTISDNCLVKVEDANRPWLVAVSPKFKVGATTFRFLAPSRGDTVCSSSNYIVQWESKYLFEFLIEWSHDGGETWESIDGAPITAKFGKTTWIVPSGFYPNVSLRATVGFHNEKREVVGESEEFSIFPCGPDPKHAVRILFVAPNPASDEATVTIQSDAKSEISIAVYNSLGGLALPEISFITASALSSRNVNLKGLAHGSYFVVARSRAGYAVYPISVVK